MAALRALTSFLAPDRRIVREGDTVDSADPIVAGREHLFEPVEQRAPVESATARPGEKRTVKRPRSDGA